MKLYNRLLMEGIFLFWDDDKKCDYYLINIYINNQDKKIKIKEERVEGNTHCYSINNIGNAEYIIEISSYKNGVKVECIEKIINLESFILKLIEIKDVIEDMNSNIQGINDNIYGLLYDYFHKRKSIY